MKQNKTILNKIGITPQTVKQWKSKGIKITYPMKVRKKFFKSQDGVVFVESADKYVPPLTKQETALYTQHPQKFKDDFMKNVTLYFKFHTFLYKKSQLIKKLKTIDDKLSSVLSLMYLFLSAMDHHYYHFDRYLAYEDYSETPVGYWWSQLKKFHKKVFNEKVSKTKPTENFLKLLSQDTKILNKFKSDLNKKEYKDLLRTLKAIKIFEDAQEREVRIISGYPAKEDLLLKSGFGIWNQICDLIKGNPETVQNKFYKKVMKLIDGHPIISTRILLLPNSLKTFRKEIYSEFINEIQRWKK